MNNDYNLLRIMIEEITCLVFFIHRPKQFFEYCHFRKMLPADATMLHLHDVVLPQKRQERHELRGQRRQRRTKPR